MRSTSRLGFLSTHGLAALVAGSLAACSGSGGDGGSVEAGTISGSLFLVAPTSGLVAEVEPNDAVDEPQAIGELAAGRTITIRGSIGAGEGFDGYALVARGRVALEAELRFAAGDGRRVELVAYDPLAMGVVARASADGKLATTAAGPLDLVVRGAQGAGAYELVVRASAAPAKIARSGWTGAVATGDALEVGGGAAARYELTTVEALDLLVTGVGPGEPVVRTRTITRDGEGGASTIGGGASVRLLLHPLERIVIETPAGSSARLEAFASDPIGDLRVPPDRLLAAESERAALGLATDDVLYGRAPANANSGDVLVKPRAGANLADDLARRGLTRTDTVGDVLQVAAGLDLVADEALRARITVALARSLAASPRVEYAELNRIRKAYGGVGPFTPNDDHIGLQWHYPLIRVPEAWGAVRNAVTGPGDVVYVAVIDTGRRPHPDLDANTDTDIEFDFITSATTAADGGGPDDVALDTGDSEGIGPSSFHGTHVAGTIAAVTDNAFGVAGIASVPVGSPFPASRVRVVHLRVLGKGGGTDADIARAIRYAAGLQNTGLPTLGGPLDIVNLSLGGPGFNQTVQSAVTAARNRGVTIFAASGNENSGTPSFPAAYADVISVAAVDHNALRAPYSNFHATVDLCAPGGDASVDTDGDGYVDGVLSSLVDEPSFDPIFVFYQGTSMACPHAAGLAALMEIASPAPLSPAEIETKLKQTATDLGAPGLDSFYGFGLINALTAVQSAGTGGSATPVLAANPTTLNFPDDTAVLVLNLLNLGGMSIDVQTITEDQPWLTAVADGAGSGIDIGRVEVVVDLAHPALAADGTYTATISVTTANAGSIDVPVTVTVQTPFFPDVDLFVIAVDFSVDPPVTVAEAVVNPAFDGLEYVLDELTTADGELLPPGDYLIACGSDDNDDGFICDVGDTYCGLYPTLNDPALVRVDGTVTGVDFVVAPQDSLEAFTAFEGWTRLARRGAVVLR